MKEELIKIIDNYQFISFDIFDTLIFRNLNKPVDLFRILSNIAKDNFGVDDFYNIRIEAEKNSRNGKNNYECSIDEIYKTISMGNIKKKVVQELKNIEIKLEKEFCVTNPFMKSIFDYCLKNKKKVVLISDMYLDKKTVLDILSDNGYKNVELYLSNDYRANKATSKLYEIVYNDKKVKKEEWLHIGDNIHSDYESPISFGINAYNYKNVSTYSDVVPNSIFESIVLGIKNNYLYNGLEREYWDSFGVNYASLIYLGFTKWLYDLTKDEDNLFFLARDGYVIKEVYDLLKGDSNIFTNYIYCSRKSIQVPGLLLGTKNKLIEAFTCGYWGSFRITLRDFLENSYVNIEKIKDNSFFEVFGFSSLDDIVSIENLENAKKMLGRLVDNIRENLDGAKDLAISYLEQEGMSKFSKINVMDIGWSGSIQYYISKLLSKEVIGYYFGTIESGKEDAFSNMFGYYFDLDKKIEDKLEVYENVMMYELLFSAPHGSTIKYNKDGDRIVPILEDDVVYNKVVSKFQGSAIEIIKEYLKYIKYFDSLNKYFCLDPFRKFLKRLDYKDMEMFSKLSTDYLLGATKKNSYVNTIRIEDIDKTSYSLLEKIDKSLWKDSFFIEGISNDDAEKYYKSAKLMINNLRNIYTPFNNLSYAKLYIDYGDGYSEENSILVPYNECGGRYSFEFDILRDFKEIRIDPVEGTKIIIRNLIIFTDMGNVKCKIPHKNYLYGKVYKGIYINSKDPRIILKDIQGAKKITFFADIQVIKKRV